MPQTNVSVIIPTLNAGTMIDDLLTSLEHQRRVPDEIIVVDSSSDDDTRDLVRRHPEVRLIVIDRKDFNHGGTRDMALRESSGDFVLFLTQDALPESDQYIDAVLAPFKQERVALVYGRQIPRADARPAETLVREFTYGPSSFTITPQDVRRLGINAFRASDVCAAYRRTAYLEVGGFENPVLTNEDMFIAARLLHAGWHVVYEAQAAVIHSHNFTWRQQYKRNYLQGVEMEKHRDILGSAPITGEGFAMVGHTMKGLLAQGKIIDMGSFFIDCVFRYVGNRKGKIDAKRAARRA
ncbi:glycosyltransferase [Bifidobacterium pseudolongum]|uniref:Glycosyl transferase family 2 n=1 Tax=Bifidobacterium pseudolongum subsp. globosum TaxID=1690 RepID=A0A4Q5AQ62_9BIFI|nr:glycosyltransferase [Bifidobacterium pseudolongum]RYQ35874.1 glycosyl transferase family 2 [Bifidobacterium pseudolongum subsp. globosum]RYQ51263.1 glycosyl transferase family 2 [Bifidobacterium pseudolongum subsp. pseudolongum]